MMSNQFDTTSAQPEENLTTADIVSAGQRNNPEPGAGQDATKLLLNTSSGGVPDNQGSPTPPTNAPGSGTPHNQGAGMAPTNAPGSAPYNTQGLYNQEPATPPAGTMATAMGVNNQAIGQSTPLFAGDVAGAFRGRWDAIQTGFVDEPRRSVEEADMLVAELMKHLAQMFAQERAALERQWAGGNAVSTEDLRLALRRYRSFFERLLSA
jgi:hypothetical protein